MERRTKLIILIIAALILLLIGIYILLMPFLPSLLPAQPPALPGAAKPSTTVLPSTTTGTQGTIPSKPSKAADIKQLEDMASIFVSRVGSGSNGDGFLGYDDVMLNATPAYRETLKADQAALRVAHSAAGSSFGLTTRIVSVDSRGAVSGAQSVPITVEAQQAEDAGTPTAPTLVKYVQAAVTFEKQADGSYLVSGVVWKDIER